MLAYETGKAFIRIKFIEVELYTYSFMSAGKQHVERMKELADEGRETIGMH
jgi:hypothetical protein